MNNILDIKTPAEGQASARKSEFGLENHGLTNTNKVYWNLTTEALYEEAIFRAEGSLTLLGPLVVNTGKHTARAANDKFIVREPTTEEHVWWGQYNRPYSAEKFDELFNRVQGYLQGRDLFIQDCYAGSDPEYRLPIRVITEKAWHSMCRSSL
jgi:phosphoenolpyruvate carboxykinase (ATP)